MAAEAFVITFREGIEASLMVGVMIAYLVRTGRSALRKWVYLGTVVGVAASLVEASVILALYNGAETAQQSILSGVTMVVASALVVTLIVWMMRTARRVRLETETKMSRRLEKGSTFGIFLLALAFVFREGSETVLFIVSLSLGSQASAQVAAGVLGLAFATVWGVLIARGAVRIDLRRFFTVTSALVSLFVVEMVGSAIHEFQEARVIGGAGTGPLWDLQIWLTTDEAKLLTMLPIVVFPLVLLLLSRARAEARTPRELLRAKAALVGVRLGAIAMTAAILILFAQAAAAGHPAYDPRPESVSVESGNVSLDIAARNITDGMLHKFHAWVGGEDVRFLVIADEGGTLRVAFDACKVCGPMGFVQTARDAVACKRCGVETSVGDIGIDISCHPLPLPSTLNGGMLRISEPSLVGGLVYFGG